MAAAPLHILILRDHRPGHYNISEGIAAAIESRHPVIIRRIDVRRGRWPGAALAAWSNTGLGAHALLSQVYGLKVDDLGTPDIIVSAGAETLAANVAAARITGAANVFYGSLRRFAATDFSLVLTSYPERADRPRHAFLMKPGPFPPNLFRRPIPGAPMAAIALLIGGDPGTFRYYDSDWDALLRLIRELHAATGACFLVTNSRRTPAAVSDRLAALARDTSAVSRFVDVRSSGSGTLLDVLKDADAVLVTADSSSMISEAVQTFRPVVALTPAGFTLPREEATYRAWLDDSGAVATLALAKAIPETLLAALLSTRPLPRGPAADLLQLLAERVPGLRHRLAIEQPEAG